MLYLCFADGADVCCGVYVCVVGYLGDFTQLTVSFIPLFISFLEFVTTNILDCILSKAVSENIPNTVCGRQSFKPKHTAIFILRPFSLFTFTKGKKFAEVSLQYAPLLQPAFKKKKKFGKDILSVPCSKVMR